MSITSISPQQFSELWHQGTIDLIDVRPPAAFREMHLAAARNVPLAELDPAAVMQARDRKAAEPLYVVCQVGGSSRKACQKFHESGFTNVVNVEGGTTACVAAGLPVVLGAKGVSLERQVRIAAGSLVLLGAVLGWLIHPLFVGLPAFVGAGLVFSGVTNTCGMGYLLALMPWNQRGPAAQTCSR